MLGKVTSDAFDCWARWMYLRYCLQACARTASSTWLHRWHAHKTACRRARVVVGRLLVKRSASALRRGVLSWSTFARASAKRKLALRRMREKRARQGVLWLVDRWRQYMATRNNGKKINIWQAKQKESNLIMSAWAFWVFVTSTHSKAVSQISKALHLSARSLFRNTMWVWYSYTKSKKRCHCIAVLVVLRCIKRQTSQGWHGWMAALLRRKHLKRVEDKIRAWDRVRKLAAPYGVRTWKELADAARRIVQTGRDIALRRVRSFVRSLVRLWQRWVGSRRASRKVAWLLRSWAVTLQRRRKERSKLVGAMNTSLKALATPPVRGDAHGRQRSPPDSYMRQRTAVTPRYNVGDYSPDDTRSLAVSPPRPFAAF
jgi:hypothetical protein